MKNSILGLIWSGLVFPGLGEIVLKHYYRGAALMVTASVCISLIVIKIVRQASDLFEKIESTGVSINTDNVVNVVIELMPESGGPSYRILILIIAGCWVVSIVDVILIGRKIDIAQRPSAPAPDLTDSVEWE